MKEMLIQCVIVEVMLFVLWLIGIYYTNRFDDDNESILGMILDGLMRLIAKYMPRVMALWIPIGAFFVGLTAVAEALQSIFTF